MACFHAVAQVPSLVQIHVQPCDHSYSRLKLTFHIMDSFNKKLYFIKMINLVRFTSVLPRFSWILPPYLKILHQLSLVCCKLFGGTHIKTMGFLNYIFHKVKRCLYNRIASDLTFKQIQLFSRSQDTQLILILKILAKSISPWLIFLSTVALELAGVVEGLEQFNCSFC